jgi:hypothetical protein
MLKPRKTYTIQGPVHPVKVKGVSQRHLDKIAAGKNETVRGCYVSKENTLYVAYDLDSIVLRHTLFHELKHVFDDQVAHMDDEEDVCDAFGTMLVNWFPDVDITKLLK